MEVHAHSHTARKKWTHYLWEFLMLFLAVFCGFLAEYQLEHKIENDRGKQYIISFFDDLKYDTSHLTAVINNYKEKVNSLNVISKCYDSVLVIVIPLHFLVAEVFGLKFLIQKIPGSRYTMHSNNFYRTTLLTQNHSILK